MTSKISKVGHNLRWNMLHNQCAVIYFLLLIFSPSTSQGKIKIDLFDIWNSAILRYNISEEEEKERGLRKDCSNQHLLGMRCFDDVPINQTFLFLTFPPPLFFETQKKDRDIFLHENETQDTHTRASRHRTRVGAIKMQIISYVLRQIEFARSRK